MKRFAIIIAVALFLAVPSGPVAAQWGTAPGSIFPNAMINLNALFGGQDPVAPPLPGAGSPWLLDLGWLDPVLVDGEPASPPIPWGGGSIVSPIFDFLGDQFSTGPGDFDFDFTPPSVPGVYIGIFGEYTGMSNTSGSTTIIGFPGQQPLIENQQFGWADQMRRWEYFFEVQ